MNRLLESVILLSLCLVSGCRREPARVTICLLDTSKSIDPQSVLDEFAAMDRLVDGMRRGDTLILIPITGSARNEVQGHILRLKAPSQRQSFDADLIAFEKDSHQRIATLLTWASANPSTRTDILGSLKVAEQEALGWRRDAPCVVVLSDFIEDDGAISFAKDSRLTSIGKAKTLAGQLAMDRHLSLTCPIYLGRVRGDNRNLSRTRQDAIDAFWSEFFSTPNNVVTIHGDGIETIIEGHIKHLSEAQ